MNQTEIEVTLKDHENEIKSLKHRMNKAEENDKVLTEILISVKELALNMSHMAEKQELLGQQFEKQDQRLEKIEMAPADDSRYYKRLILGCIITAVVSGCVGAVLALIFK